MPSFTQGQLNFYLWIFLFLGMIFLVIYFKLPHDEDLSSGSEFDLLTQKLAGRVGKITHDDHQWFVNGKSICVGYGDPGERCPRHQVVCSSRPPKSGKGFSYGSVEEQASLILESSGEMHPRCPVL